MAIISYSQGHFFVVQASNSTAYIYPGSLEVVNSFDNTKWQNTNNVYFQDLSQSAELKSFNKLNSAYILSLKSEMNYDLDHPIEEENVAEELDNNDESGSEDTSFDNDNETNDPASDEEGQVLGDEEENDNFEHEEVLEDIIEEENEVKEETVTEEQLTGSEAGSKKDAKDISSEIVAPEIEPASEPTIETPAQSEPAPAPEPAPEPPSEDISFLQRNINIAKAVLLSWKNDLVRSKSAKAQDAEEAFMPDEAVVFDENNSPETDVENIEENILEETVEEEEKSTPGQVSSLIFSNFSLPLPEDTTIIEGVKLIISLAAKSEQSNDYISLEYKTDNVWQELSVIDLSTTISNSNEGRYIIVPLKDSVAFSEIDNMDIRLSYHASSDHDEDKELEIFLDALWLELDYSSTDIEEEEEEEEEEVAEFVESEEAKIKKGFELNQVSETKNFKFGDKLIFTYQFRQKRNIVGRMSEEVASLFYDKYKDIKIDAKFKDLAEHESAGFDFNIVYLDDGEFQLEIDNKLPRQFKPGKHILEISISDPLLTTDYTIDFSQDFTWGVLALNTNKATYLTGETSFLQMAVLDDLGHTICDADLVLEITAPDGGVAELSTDNGLLVRDSACGPDNVIDTPDYYAYYGTGLVGDYQMRLVANTRNGQREITDVFSVAEELPYEIERVGPTRIYPWAGYRATFNVKANKDFQGSFTEYMPASFDIIRMNGTSSTAVTGDTRELSWEVDWKKGETYSYFYIFDAPNISPEFFLLGPATVGVEVVEARQWQIASDAEVTNAIVEQISPVLNTTATMANLVVASSTLFTGGDTYLIYTHAGFSHNALTNLVDYEIVYGSSVQFAGTLEPAGDSNDAMPMAWFDVYTQPLTPEDIIVRFANSTTGEARGMNAQIFILNLSELSAEDYKFAEDTTTQQHTTTMDNRASITLDNADGAKDWLIMAMEEVVVDAGNRNYEGEIYDGTSSYMWHSKEGENAAEVTSYVLHRSFDDVALNTTFTMRVRDDQVGINDHQRSRIFALNLDRFESHKTFYLDGNVDISDASWTELGNLNSGGNYSPNTTGDQIIFASFIDDCGAGTAGIDDRLLVNGVTTPSGWSWSSNPPVSRTSHDASDELFNNVITKISIPSTGQTISYEAFEVSGTSQIGDEISMTVFSTELATLFDVSADEQTESDDAPIINGNWSTDSTVKLWASAFDVSAANTTFYFELIPESGTATTTLIEPSAACASGSDYNDCDSKIWEVSSAVYSNAASGTVSIANIPDSANGYKWQVISWDANGANTIWREFNSITPNFYLDATAPILNGDLALLSTGGDEIVLDISSATATEENFLEYKIFYATSSNPAELDMEHDDANFDDILFNGATESTINNLQPDTVYYINIWAYDNSGLSASGTELVVRTSLASRVKTVEFLAGVYSGDGTTGQNSETDHTLPNFNFKLVEEGVKIKNAYILFEAQFEAYADNGGTYDGYDLTFDTCVEPCTADAFNGAGRASTSDRTVLAYNEEDSNQVRLLLDVTNEAQLASYNGGNLEGELGYNIRSTLGAVQSIASAKAKLYVTYYYDKNSLSYTNTVIYPLESTNGIDTGSRQSVQTDDCTLDLDCPLFSYNMDIPEFFSSHYGSSLSQWFTTYNVNDSNVADDVHVDVNIEGDDNDSTEFVHEAATSREISNTTAMYFDSVSGFAENTDQTLEYHSYNPDSGGNYYLVGGEVTETYTASSSASVKTRTVALPLGVINNGLTSATTTGSVAVSFPENGNSTGNVTIKKAWFRIISNNYADGANTFSVETRVGANATSSTLSYNHNTGREVAKPSFNIIHVIPAGDYTELANANASTSTLVYITTQNSNDTTRGGTAAELMITYTYTDESEGYLNSLNIFAGQSDTDGNARLATTSSVIQTFFPESDSGQKNILAGALLASYFYTASDASVGAGYTLGANLATSAPVCVDSFEAYSDNRNAFIEYYADVSSVLTTNNNQTYAACYSNDGGGDAASGAKMNGQLIYTYSWYDPQAYVVKANDQLKSDDTTSIPNNGWTNESEILLSAQTTAALGGPQVDFYYEVRTATSTFSTATGTPSGACASGTAFNSCASKLWNIEADSVSQVIEPSDWYGDGWLYRKTITLDSSQVAIDLTDFPVLATTTDSDLASEALATGFDIVFTASDGTTKLNYEREYYNSGTGELIAWIKTDVSSTVDTEIYMYYGNASVTEDNATTTGVWDSNYDMVQHLTESSGSGNYVLDSTVNNNDGAPGGTDPTHISNAYIDGGWDFAGANQERLEFPDSASLQNTTAITAEVWARADSWTSPDHNPVLWKGSQIGWGAANYNFRIAVSNGAPTWGFGCGGTEGWFAGGAVSTGNWYHYVLTFNGTNSYAYINGVQVGTTANCSGNTLNPLVGQPVRSGFGYRDSPTTETHFDGQVGEIKISSIARSPQWIAAEYNNQHDVAGFMTIGSAESPNVAILEEHVSVTGLPTNYNGYGWQVKACDATGACSGWDRFDVMPNFKVDTILPDAPGSLTLGGKSNTTATLDFGFQTYDAKFLDYKIFYKEGTSGVTVDDIEHDDTNLDHINYNGADDTTVYGLKPDTEYVFNIWAFDEAGNARSAATELQVTTDEAPRARTVRFIGGTYSSSDGSNGQDSDTDQTFSVFNFSLAENSVSIESAYVIFEAQFEAYVDNANDYTGYELTFDSCQEPCTANAFTGSGRAYNNDTTTLAFNESGSEQVRILLDVTNETQLRQYSGSGVELQAQIGYNLERGAAVNSIANSRAELVVTYSFDENSESITNTVVYPLESTASGDSGTKRSVQADDCTLDSDCPLFAYNIEIPEYITSSGAQRLDYWFRTFENNDGNGGADVYMNINIEGDDATSSTFIHEAALGGTQGNLPGYIFSDVSGFSENTSQDLEIQSYVPGGGATHYIMGGEVYETYTASSAAPVKTRTVSFPMGVINNGLTTANTLGAVDVYFPENSDTTGVVSVKKAWFRIKSSNYTSNANTIDVSAKVGDNASSSAIQYDYDAGGTVVNPVFTIIHVIPSSDYTELESANGETAKTVLLNTVNSNGTEQGGLSVELMITYTYSDETDGYLSSFSIFAEQANLSADTQTASSSGLSIIIPEKTGKTILAASLLTSYLTSDSDFNVTANYKIDANMGTSSVVCSNSFEARNNANNSFIEFYKDVTSNLSIDGNDTYEICMSNDGGGDPSGGAKMNSQLIYTYRYYNPPPVSNTANQQYKGDGFTAIPNGNWTNDDDVWLSAIASDNSTSTEMDFYFELIGNGGSFSTSSEPASACSSGTAYGSCTNKIWTVNRATGGSLDWYDPDWLYRKKITINSAQVSADQTDFPVLATTSDPLLADTVSGGNVASSTGGDIIVTDSDGTTLLNFEREYYSSTTGELVLWIKTDVSATINKELYIYYGNASASEDLSTTTGVWDSDYVAVWHMSEGGTGLRYDSTGNFNATPQGYEGDEATTGWIDGADDLEGTNDYLETSQTATSLGIGGAAAKSISAWVYTEAFTTAGIFEMGTQANGQDFSLRTNGSNNNWRTQFWGGAFDMDFSYPSLNQWVYFVTDYDGTTATVYADDTVAAQQPRALNTTNTKTFKIGGWNGAEFNGRIDEVRISSVSRSQDWVTTEYNNQVDVSTFLSFNSEESYNSPTYEESVSITAIPDSVTGYKWQTIACNDLGSCSPWDLFGLAPNFKVDANPPTAPGNLTVATTTAATITLNFGATTTETNFTGYKIFYKAGLTEVDETDTEHIDANLAFIDYNEATSTKITNLQANTQYVINIWAYDAAGNKTQATEITVITQSAPHSRARTVKFPAGIYTGDGTTGQNSDTSQTFSTFNFSLAEAEVDIRNAYIIFEAQFEAYVDNAGDYNGYTLSFDACDEPCTANAFTGTDVVSVNDSTVLAYDEAMSNQVRLLYDVTDEVQLTAYTGEGSQLEAQVGYSINRGTAVNSIANANAALVVTYSYNEEDSTNFTNTITYPLESTSSGDSGSRRAVQAANCTLDSSCPMFAYNLTIPEVSSAQFKWFETYFVNDGNGGTDLSIDVNVNEAGVVSTAYVHESQLGGTQGNVPMIRFNNVFGTSENSAQNLEYRISGGGTHYALGGEVFETYSAALSAPVKTRTVSFPMGEIAPGNDTNTSSGTVNVYFPENGGASGIVEIKKAWFRVKNADTPSGAYSLTLSSKVGSQTQSGNYIYNVDVGGTVIKPSYTVIHVIPSVDYTELESANASTEVPVSLWSANSNVNMGGVSAELMITYTYTDESNGYLTSLNVYGGQSDLDADSQNATSSDITVVFPELRGTETLRAGAMLGSFLFSAGDGSMPTDFYSTANNIGVTVPTCTNSHNVLQSDAQNAFGEAYYDITANLLTTDAQNYYTCFSNTSSLDATVGAKMNAQLIYTYQWEAPPSEFTQSDWRWYENTDASQPVTALANENTAITSVDIGDVVRIRMSVGVTNEDLAVSSQAFKLQYGKGSDCNAVATWTDVGGYSSSEPWRGYNNPAPADGATLPGLLLASSTVLETYEERNNSSANPNAVNIGEFGEWDWVVNNNGASSSAQYCFRMVESDGDELTDYLSDSYPKLTTNKANTEPNSATDLEQYRSDDLTVIPNLAWVNDNDVLLSARATDPNINETITLYFQLASSSASFITATSAPSGACVYGTAFSSCASRVWFVANGSPGNYQTNPYVGTTSITNIPESSSGFKWQVLSCDKDDECSNWVQPGSSPNFRIDTTAPTLPGSLTLATTSPTSLIVNFGATSTEANFDTYKIFYKVGTSDVTEDDIEHTDTNLGDILYNDAATSTIINLSANTTYVFNIWAYDFAGNVASATTELVETTSSSFTPPTGQIVNLSQKTDGSGKIDVVMVADDADNDDTLRAKFEFATGTDCIFGGSVGDPTLDDNDAYITATYGDPDIDNNQEYQVGTSTAWIMTSPGTNYVLFDWFSKADIPNANGTYCMQITVNDGLYDSATHTKLILIDNEAPATPAALTLEEKDYDSVVLGLNTPFSSDTRFDRYRIFYKEGISGSSVNDTEHVDANLLDDDYNSATSTEITGLNPNTNYVFNIWAYDTRGNRSSSTEINIKTNAIPTNIEATDQLKADLFTSIVNGGWTNENSVVMSASVHDQDATDLVTFYYELLTDGGTFTSATTPPANTCTTSSSFLDCATKIWSATTSTSNLPTDWYHGDWLYRKSVTVNSSQIYADETGFVVLATTTDASLATKARSDGYDIVFTASDGTTTLPFEREYFNDANGQLVAWIKMDISSTTDTSFYMYYGNIALSTDMSTTTGVWDSNFKGVWHLGESVVDESSQASVHIDSSGNNNNGNQTGNNEISGKIGLGQEFDGDDYIRVSDDNSLDMIDELTMTAWFNVSASEWKYSRPITLSGATAEANFQVMIELGTSNFDYSKADVVGDDLRFYDSNDVEQDYWIETWNTSGTSTIWVEVADAGETQLTMKYGNDSAGAVSSFTNVMQQGGLRYFYYDGITLSSANLQGTDIDDDINHTWGNDNPVIINNPPNTWEDQSNTVSIRWEGWVVNDGSGTTTFDVTSDDGQRLYVPSNNMIVNNWVNQGDNTEYADYSWSGPISIMYEYYEDGGGATAILGWDPPASGQVDPIPSTNLYYRKYMASEPVATIGAESGAGINKSGAYAFVFDTSLVTATINNTVATATVSSGWNLATLSYDRTAGSDQMKLYLNGTLVKTETLTDTINSNSMDLIMGNLLDGLIDEVQISDIARPDTWIRTQNNNLRGAGGFVSYGFEERVTSFFETVLVIDIPDSPTQTSGYKWQVMACDDDNDCSGWTPFNVTVPNFKVDTVDPTAPGALSESSKTSNSITLAYGAQTSEQNFSEYRIFYSTSTQVYETDYEHDSADLDSINYAGESLTTVNQLAPSTVYYFNIWAYDQVGRKASSTVVAITTNPSLSSPGVSFYTKNDRTLYYQVWDGTDWGTEQTGPTFGSQAGDNIRHIRSIASDDRGKVAVLVKTWNTTNREEWWGTVYRFVADDFVNTTQLGATANSAVNNNLITGCMGSLSGGEFMVVTSNGVANGSLVYSWSVSGGWTSEGAGPDPGAVMNGCSLERRPGTDNYLLMTFDDTSDVGSSYYTGGSSYTNSWTTWTQHSGAEDSPDNYVGVAYFDPSDNTRGAMNYSNSATNWTTYAKFFVCDNTSINYGSESESPVTAPDVWTDDWVDGEFAVDPAGTGVAYLTGRDIDNRASVLKLDISTNAPVWSRVASGTDIAGTNLYPYGNFSQKPYATTFYKDNKGITIYNDNTNQYPYYRKIDASDDSMDTVSIAVPGADANAWTRARVYDDPNEDEFIAIFQNDDVDYAAVFFEGGFDRFYNSADNPGSNQVWTELVTTSGAFDQNDENITFSFASYNSPPSAPFGLQQYKTDASSTVANGGWTNEDTVLFNMSVNDTDTDEVVKLYLQLVADTDSFSASTTEPINSCASTTSFSLCTSKIWLIASSSGDFSLDPLTATATIAGIGDSDIGYKWQVIACDDEVECSAWKVFNATQPNFYVDTLAPTAPGALTITTKNSDSVTLTFGAQSNEDHWGRYRIFYKEGSSGVLQTDTEHIDNDLLSQIYGGTTNTVVVSLSSSTQYVFNIWAYDLAGNFATATPEVSTTTSATENLEQTSFLFENDNGTTVNNNTAAAAVDTSLLNLYQGERLNARIQIENNGGDEATDIVYSLQFENQTDNPGTWVNVGAATEISYGLGLSGSNGDAVTIDKAAANTGWIDGTWHENSGQTGAFTLNYNEYTELVFNIHTQNANLGDTYRLRLYNSTDGAPLDNYSLYPTLSIAGSDSIRYSKETNASLPTGTTNSVYYLDPVGYTNVSLDDSSRDPITSVSQYAIKTFFVHHGNNSDALSVTWNGQSSVAASVNNVVLQVYKYGSPNQWVTVDTNSSALANTDFSLTASLNSSLSSYYGVSNWTYWRVYQSSGDQTLRTDYFNVTFSSPTPLVEQLHYRWRNDNGNQTAATWRELEDLGDPAGATDPIEKYEKIRLRFEVANVGAGTAANYNYGIEYATSSGSCTVGIGEWTQMPVDYNGHWRMATSTYFADSDVTTAQLSNSEGYTFTAGRMVEDTSSTTVQISLNEEEFTEIEYAIMATANAKTAGTYCFRVTDNTVPLDNYDVYPIITIAGNTNNAPFFTVEPSDNGSASTSPTDYGSDVTFTATAQDVDNDDYYLAICKTNSITAGNDGPPSCTAGDWCISSLTASSSEASCTYTTADASEALDWYAFVCDKYPGFSIAKCSLSSQGSGDSVNDSPFVINHAPAFTSVVTSVDNRDPGSTFTITTVSSDTDTVGGIDQLTLHVCEDNSASPAGCAGTTLCSAVATSSPNAKCSFTDVAPTPATTTIYYAFLFDSHGLAASSNSRSSSYTINNVAPTLGGLLLNDGNDITLNIMGASDTTISTVNANIVDLNGCDDIESAIGVIYLSSVASGFNCTADDNNCYQIAVSNCSIECSGAGSTVASTTCSADMKYFATPTDDSTNNPNETDNWKSYMQIYDGSNYVATTSPGVELYTTSALTVVENVIDFGSSFSVGQNTGAKNSTSTIQNAGNSPIDTNISGTDMVGIPSGTIDVGEIKWNIVNFNYELETNALANSNQLVNIIAPKPTSITGVEEEMYWGISIPYGSDPSAYFGQNSFQVILDSDDW